MADKGKKLAVAPTDLEWLDGVFQFEKFFGAWTPAGIQELLPTFALQSFSKGAAIVNEGESGSDLFILYKGAAGVQRKKSAAKKLAQLGPGDFFGEMGFLKNAPRSATVTALEDCQVFSMSPADMNKIFEQNPGIAERIEAIARDRLSEPTS